ncbi:MAG TPA: hypothetical protein VK571_09070 [Gemmatimonadaceae bacterium]|nr:hypothetical protein [Gemmatimonadaceae bacterium]
MPEGGATPGGITWVHTDTRGIQAATAAAYARAVQGRWTRDEDSVQDQRALVLYACMSSAALSPAPPALENNAVIVRPGTRASSPDAQDWQTTLIWGVVYLLGVSKQDIDAGRMNLTARAKVETEDGAMPAGPYPDTGFPFLAVVAIVSATTALAGVLALWLSQRNEIDATRIASDERVQKHAQALAEASSVVDAHIQAEKASGQTLPWDTEQVKYLDELKSSIRELAKTPDPPMKSVPDLGAVSGAVAGAVTDAGTGVKNAGAAAGGGFGIVVGLGLLYLLSKEHEGRESRAAA